MTLVVVRLVEAVEVGPVEEVVNELTAVLVMVMAGLLARLIAADEGAKLAVGDVELLLEFLAFPRAL